MSLENADARLVMAKPDAEEDAVWLSHLHRVQWQKRFDYAARRVGSICSSSPSVRG